MEEIRRSGSGYWYVHSTYILFISRIYDLISNYTVKKCCNTYSSLSLPHSVLLSLSLSHSLSDTILLHYLTSSLSLSCSLTLCLSLSLSVSLSLSHSQVMSLSPRIVLSSQGIYPVYFSYTAQQAILTVSNSESESGSECGSEMVQQIATSLQHSLIF